MIKRQLFYSHLIEVDQIIFYLNEMDMADEEREEMVDLIEDIIHHRILEGVLEILPKEHHAEFVEKMTNEPHNRELVMYIKERSVSDPEEKIVSVFTVVKEDILSEVKKVKKKKRVKRG